MKGEVYRYYIKDKNQYSDFVTRGRAYLTSDQKAESLEELKSNLMEEKGYNKRTLNTMVNGFKRMTGGDFLWMRYSDRFALGKILSPAEFTEGQLTLKTDFHEVNRQVVPPVVLNSFKGLELQRILKDHLYEETLEIYESFRETPVRGEDSTSEEAAVETVTEDSFQMEFTKEAGGLVEIHPPMVKGKNELSIVKEKDDIRLTYEAKKKKEPSFELVIEMHAPKDLRIDKKKSGLPAVIAKTEKEALKMIDIYERVLEDQMTFFINWQKMNFNMFLRMQYMFCDNYIKFLKLFK